jgi:hypothetical protein
MEMICIYYIEVHMGIGLGVILSARVGGLKFLGTILRQETLGIRNICSLSTLGIAA